MLTYAIFILLVVGGVKSENDSNSEGTQSMQPCCFPREMTSDVQINGRKVYTVHVDYNNMAAVEEYNSKYGVDYRVYDLELGKRYSRKKDGSCKAEDYVKYAPCIPPSATHKIVATEGDTGDKLVAFRYWVDAADLELVVRMKTCTPSMANVRVAGQFLQIHYKNQTSTIDPSVFDKDIKDCK